MIGTHRLWEQIVARVYIVYEKEYFNYYAIASHFTVNKLIEIECWN